MTGHVIPFSQAHPLPADNLTAPELDRSTHQGRPAQQHQLTHQRQPIQHAQHAQQDQHAQIYQLPTPTPDVPVTYLLRVVMSGVVTRHIGVADSLTVREFMHVIAVSFGLQAAPVRLPGTQSDQLMSEILSTREFPLDFTFGLLPVTVDLIDTFVRDRGTPRALCVGGSGQVVGDEPVDISTINLQLTNPEDFTAVFTALHPAPAEVIVRSQIFDFVPLIQALDLGQVQPLSKQLKGLFSRLSAPGHEDAKWVILLAGATLSDAHVVEEVAVTTFQALGYSVTTMAEIAALHPTAAAVYRQVAAFSPVEQIEFYRHALANPLLLMHV